MIISALLGGIVGFFLGALLVDGRWRRLRARHYWLRPPHTKRLTW